MTKKTTQAAATQTREEWLIAFTQAARPIFEAEGFPLPRDVRVSIGFTSKGARGKAIGQCWDSGASADKHFEIFIRPNLQGNASRVADVLTHELVHAAVGLKAGHGAKFRKCATALGLTGKMTATVAGEKFHGWAKPILDKLGPFPGDTLNGQDSGPKKQSTRLLKVECSDGCGVVLRASAKVAAMVVGGTCPACEEGHLELEEKGE
jgi:hypothetical protein